MECLQYIRREALKDKRIEGFKPCYKWNAFNTNANEWWRVWWYIVLNLVISGMPSILKEED